MALAFCILTSNEWEVLLLHILTSIWGCQCLDIGCSNRCVEVFHVVLICISLMIYDMEHLFICLFAICVSSLMRSRLKSLTFLKSDSLLSYHWILRVLCVFWIKILHQMSFTNIFSKPVLSSDYFNIVFHRV